MRYRCLAFFCAAVAATLFCNINSEVVLAAVSEMADLGPLPEFVPQAGLTQFLLAVRETTMVSRTARQAAEELSAKFEDNSSKQEVGDRFIRWEPEAAIEDPKPPILVAAISDVAMFDVLDPKGRGKAAKLREAAAGRTKAVKALDARDCTAEAHHRSCRQAANRNCCSTPVGFLPTERSRVDKLDRNLELICLVVLHGMPDPTWVSNGGLSGPFRS